MHMYNIFDINETTRFFFTKGASHSNLNDVLNSENYRNISKK